MEDTSASWHTASCYSRTSPILISTVTVVPSKGGGVGSVYGRLWSMFNPKAKLFSVHDTEEVTWGYRRIWGVRMWA